MPVLRQDAREAAQNQLVELENQPQELEVARPKDRVPAFEERRQAEEEEGAVQARLHSNIRGYGQDIAAAQR